jgi:hypothetical protein
LSYQLPEDGKVSGDFTPFENLNGADILSWVEESVGAKRIAEMQKVIDARLVDMTNPKEEIVSAPWITKENSLI